MACAGAPDGAACISEAIAMHAYIFKKIILTLLEYERSREVLLLIDNTL